MFEDIAWEHRLKFSAEGWVWLSDAIARQAFFHVSLAVFIKSGPSCMAMENVNQAFVTGVACEARTVRVQEDLGDQFGRNDGLEGG